MSTELVDEMNEGHHNMQNEDIPPHTAEKDKIYKCDIVKIIMQRTNRITRSFQDISGNVDNVDVMEANGSVQSIFDWAKKQAWTDTSEEHLK